MKFSSGILYGPGPVPSHQNASPRTSYTIVSIAPASYSVDPSFVIGGLSIQKFFSCSLGHDVLC